MRDDAVSPIVAFMLLLMIVVSVISVLNAYYIPSLKQQSEIQHLHAVEESFTKLSADILQVLTFRQNISMKEPVQLGGGEAMFSSIKSSGYLEVNTSLQEVPLSSVLVMVDSTQAMKCDINRSQILYHPVGNFWVGQGYVWEDGVLTVSKGNRKTFLQYGDDADTKSASERNDYYEMLAPRIDIKEHDNNITNITIDLINLENAPSYRAVNGNGGGLVEIELNQSKTCEGLLNNTTILTFQSDTRTQDIIGVNSTIYNKFTDYSRFNMALTGTSDNYTLALPSSAHGIIPDSKFAKFQITMWNLSFRVH
ncbi:MAG: hypothetical protein LUQ50_05380 [Methanospirillum sp.]|uniref:hypothetical protein n=1 Tax=Methanospirillum sp. TaxID=45200 RepID=UPI00236EE155|nr:hypothetical protein [Methanospirillum sp.]MDD1728485.1 hypothetical protein [Methanospirillum sp.]